MENEKLLSQELNLIDQLLDLVSSKQEYDCLVARARQICPFWLAPSARSGVKVCDSQSMVKGGAV
jgi:hypothetical protein